MSGGDYTLEDSVYILFTTRAFATGIPGVLSAATVAVYEDVTATPIETSIAVTETLNSINGLNAVTIAALAASGYNAGGHYHVVIEAGTVDSVSVVGEVIGSFTIAASDAVAAVAALDTVVVRVETDTQDIQSRLPAALVSGLMSSDVTAISTGTTAADNLELQYDGTGITGDTFPATQSQVSNIQSAGAAVNSTVKASPNGFTITTGDTETNTEDSTFALDGTVHSITDTGGTLDVYYEADIGAGVPTSITVHGYVNGNNDDLPVYGYDWIASGWVQIGTWEGKAASTVETQSWDLFTAMVGTGGDRGTVRIRFANTGLTTATLAVDQILVSFSQGASIYDDGAIWIDTALSNTNTVAGIDGVSTNPVSTIAAANTLATALNLNRFHIAPASTITLAAAQSGQVFIGESWTLALGGQDISGSTFIGATVSGIAAGTGTTQIFRDCIMGACSHIKGTHMLMCGIAGTQTVAEAGDFFLDLCHSGIAGNSTWIWEFGDAIGNTNLNVRNYSGGIQLESMGDTGTDTASIEGQGNIIEGTCTGGAVSVRGMFTTSGITNITLTDNARIDTLQINTEVDTGITDAALATATALATVDGNVDAILIDTGTTLPASLAALNDISVADLLTTQMTESYAANGAAPTLAQAQFAMHQMLMQFGIASTSLTVRKLDDATTAFVVTLDDATSPTDAKRV